MKLRIAVLLALGCVVALTTAATAFASHARPNGASALRVPIVLAYEECGDDEAPNRTHGPALSFPSCNPAQQLSPWLTTGTTDANGFAPQGVASIKVNVCPNGTTAAGNCSTPAGMSAPDVRLEGSSTDIRCRVGAPTQQQCEGGAFSDYLGEVEGNAQIRITDHHNSITPGGTGDTGTVIDIPFPTVADCSANPAGAGPTAIGANCNVVTHANAVVPGAVQPGKRANVEIQQIVVTDGGQDGLAGTTDNQLLGVQGIFIP